MTDFAPHRTTALAAAYAACKRIARHHENFPVGSLLFPRRLRNHFFALYAFSRVADDIADEGACAPAERLRQLDAWESLLHEAYSPDVPTHPVFMALADTIRQFHLPMDLFARLLSAFRQDVITTRYETHADVLAYCTRSANPVGRLCFPCSAPVPTKTPRAPMRFAPRCSS